MRLTQDKINAVDEVARVFYIDGLQCKIWNEYRGDAPCLLAGWCWSARQPGSRGQQHQTGLKTPSAAYRDAWYHLVAKVQPPRITQSRKSNRRQRTAKLKLIVNNREAV